MPQFLDQETEATEMVMAEMAMVVTVMVILPVLRGGPPVGLGLQDLDLAHPDQDMDMAVDPVTSWMRFVEE